MMDPSSEQMEEIADEIDALNDETFGCDLADINDDWECEPDKLPDFFGENHDNEEDENKKGKPAKFPSHFPNIEDLLNKSSSNKNAAAQRSDDLFPNCEDIVKKSISNFILDDDLYDEDEDICPDFSSYDIGDHNESNHSGSTSKQNTKSINLESLRPPSPSILPFDDPFMSSVWRPLSPSELNNQIPSKSPQKELIRQPTPKESKVLTLEELEKNFPLNGHNGSTSLSSVNISQAKVFRLEDLEAQLLENNKPKVETPFSKTLSDASPSPNVSTQAPTYVQDKIPTNILEIAAMSLAKLAIQPQTSSTNKTVPPPPGLAAHFPTLQTVADAKATIPTSQPPFFSNVTNQKVADAQAQALQNAQMAAMVNALAGMSQLPTMRPPQMAPMPMMPGISSPVVLDPLVQHEQQRLISRIITPAQAQRSYSSHSSNNFSSARQNHDKFAGFMTQKEKEWLVKIFRLQCKVNDPYVEDYYEVNFKVKKATQERRQNLAKQHNKSVDDVEIDSMIDSEPLIVLPELAKVEEDKPKYIQFDNTLGKIQVLNTKCPRKLLDVNPGKSTLFKVDSYSRLMKIERLYEHLLNIEDEDKRMPILPQSIIRFHLEKRVQLCQLLFSGLVRSFEMTKDESTMFTLIKRNMPTLKRLSLEVDPEVLNVEKGMLLLYRSLSKLRDENQLVVLLASLLKGCNYRKSVLECDRISNINNGTILIKTLSRVQQTRNLIYIAAAIDDLEVITNNKYGTRFLTILFKQYQSSDEKLLFLYFWKLFVQTLAEQVASSVELRQLCIDHFQYLTQL